MYHFILTIHVLAAVCVIVFVLLQQGKGATIGASFGSGASQTVFGSRGSGSFLFRVTIGFITVFFVTSITLNYLATQMIKNENQLILPKSNKSESIPTGVSPNSIPTTRD